MDKEELRDKLVESVQHMAALITEYAKVLGDDVYTCGVEFTVAAGNMRIRVTDSRHRMNPETGRLERIDKNSGKDSSTLDEAEARRQKGDEREPEDAIRPAPKATPEQVVAEMMKRLGLK